MAKKLVVGNWKLNPQTLEEAKSVVRIVSRKIPTKATVIICPPAVFLSALAGQRGKSKIKFGVQTVSSETSGAYTGEFSAQMAKSAGAEYAIIGHSERREMGETNKIVSKKVVAALKAKLMVILCVGEKERDHHGHYLSYLKAQIDESLEGVSKNLIDHLIIVYEPIWAIGEKSSGPMEARDLHETSLFVRKVLHDHFGKKAFSVPLLYGGSVDPINAEALIKDGNVEGLLVGRESVKPEHFSKIINAVV
jgi:triosephosphate isomerase